ncbi:hypothetical protein VCV18_004543 [Metarhizium anisopliae]
MKFLLLSLCLSVSAAPIPSPASLIDINANNNDLKFPINVLGLQGNDVNALNGNLAGNSASNGQTNNNAANGGKESAPKSDNTRTNNGGTTTTNNVNTNHASNSLIGVNTNGNKLDFPINVLGAQANGVTALNGNLADNSASNGQTNNGAKPAEPKEAASSPNTTDKPTTIKTSDAPDAETDASPETDSDTQTETSAPGNTVSQPPPVASVPNNQENNAAPTKVVTYTVSPIPVSNVVSAAQPGSAQPASVDVSSVVNAVNGLTAAITLLTGAVGQGCAKQ